jgi:hypothetical protein
MRVVFLVSGQYGIFLDERIVAGRHAAFIDSIGRIFG